MTKAGRVLSLHVVGADYPNADGGNRRTEIAFCDAGEFIELRLEPRNRVDPNAVAVLSARGFQIGYLMAEKAAWIAGIMRQGREIRAIFQQPTARGAAIRLGLDGAVPILPVDPGPSAMDDGQTEWPDGVDWIPPDD